MRLRNMRTISESRAARESSADRRFRFYFCGPTHLADPPRSFPGAENINYSALKKM
jgi:hypothetical protein